VKAETAFLVKMTTSERLLCEVTTVSETGTGMWSVQDIAKYLTPSNHKEHHRRLLSI
jgi:hypothetical protein